MIGIRINMKGVRLSGADIFFFILLILASLSIIDESEILILKIWAITIGFRLIVYLIEKYIGVRLNERS